MTPLGPSRPGEDDDLVPLGALAADPTPTQERVVEDAETLVRGSEAELARVPTDPFMTIPGPPPEERMSGLGGFRKVLHLRISPAVAVSVLSGGCLCAFGYGWVLAP